MDSYILVYAHNMEQKINFPCKDMDHVNKLVRLIMDSDSLNDCVGISYFDLYLYDAKTAKVGDRYKLELKI